MKAKYKQVERDFQINIWSHISQVSYYIQWCHEIKKWFYVNVHDTAIKLQCKKIIQSQRDTIKQSQVQFFIIFSTKNILTYLKLCRLNWSLSRVSILIFWLNSNTQFQHSDSIWYWSWVNTWFKFSTQLIKKLKMTSRELNIEIFPIFRLCITFLHYLFDRKS